MKVVSDSNRHTGGCRKGRKRLLILDGHGSHRTKEFLDHCDARGVIPFGLPPNLTYVLQPLDVVIFQPWNVCGGAAVELPGLGGTIVWAVHSRVMFPGSLHSFGQEN